MLNFLKTKKDQKDSLLNLIRERQFSGTPISLIGSSPARKSRFIADVLTPLAVEAGQSFSVLRQSEGLLFEECIKERSHHGHSILSASLQTNSELNDYLADIVAKESASKPTHIIIRYPDDEDRFKSQSRSEVEFITSCISGFARSITPKLGTSLDPSDARDDVVKPAPNIYKYVPVYFGDINRYLTDQEFLGYVMVLSSQMRSLGYQSFFNTVVETKEDLDRKLWELSSANTFCRVLLESDHEKANIVSQELNRYVDARFHGEAVSFDDSCLTSLSSEFACAVYPDKKKLIAPRMIKLG